MSSDGAGASEDTGSHSQEQEEACFPAWFRRSVPENRQRQKLTQKSLMMLVPFIGGNWEFVAMELDITAAQVEKFKKANPGSPDSQMMNVFLKWLQARGSEATLEAFVRVLWKCNNLCTVDWDGIEKILINGNNMD
ncbi:death domain-containing protein CRADD-like [Haliotis cracherodii]|uniref:death domain-containing protein CRADD-like n=1 Tax=Haliotis cracherodii TaxID=6455 RepID=UPI0039EA6AD9